MQLYHCTVTLYMTKGISAGKDSFVGVWSLDKFLIPSHPFRSIQSLIKHRADTENDVHTRKHTTSLPCYILLRSRGLKLKHPFRLDEEAGAYPWVGVKFAADFYFMDLVNQTWLGAFNFMLPIDLSLQLGVPLQAVCEAQLDTDTSTNDGNRSLLSNIEKIEYDAVSADFEYISNQNNNAKQKYLQTKSKDTTSFYEKAKRTAHAPASTMLFEYLPEGLMDPNKRRLYNMSKVKHKNRYVTEFSQKVISSLRRANLDLIVSLNLPKEPARLGTAVEHWPQYKTIDQESVLVF